MLAIGGLVGGCGLRGPLLMPKEDALPELAAAAKGDQPPPAPTANPVAVPIAPNKPFILDSLIR